MIHLNKCFQRKASIFLLLTSLLASSCISFTGFQDGRTAGLKNYELIVSGNVAVNPELNAESEYFGYETPSNNFGFTGAMLTYGITEKVDLSFRTNSFLNLGVATKIQIHGDQSSFTAFSVGAEVATFITTPFAWNVQIPTYFSIHPNDKFSCYISPRYIHQFKFNQRQKNGMNYLGGNTGFLIGRKHKIGIDVGYFYLAKNELKNASLFQAGVAGVFKF